MVFLHSGQEVLISSVQISASAEQNGHFMLSGLGCIKPLEPGHLNIILCFQPYFKREAIVMEFNSSITHFSILSIFLFKTQLFMLGHVCFLKICSVSIICP